MTFRKMTVVRSMALLAIGFVPLFAQKTELDQTIATIQGAIEKGDLTAATRLIDSALKQHPSEGGLLNLRGVIHAKSSDLEAAHRDFAEAVRLDPKLIPAWKNLARACEMEAGTGAQASSCAIGSWQRVAQIDPSDLDAATALADIYESQGKYAASLEQLQKLPSSAASKTAMLLLRCADYAGMGQIAKANTAAGQLALRKDLSEADLAVISSVISGRQTASIAILLLDAVDARQSLSPEGLKKLAIAEEQANHVAEARQTLERLAALDPNNPAHLIELARLAELTGDHEGALGYLGHARDLAPGDPQVHYLIAMIAAKMDLPIVARKSLDRALAIEPDNPHYNYAMGYVILSTRDAATASNYFQKYVKANPANPLGHYALGISYFASGDYAKAKLEMKFAENSDKAAGANYFLGRMAFIEGNLDEAQDRLRKSIEQLPSFAPSHTELAKVWMARKDLAGAEKELEVAKGLDPNNFQTNEQLLIVYKRRHDARTERQEALLKKLDEDRSKRAELMLRTIELRP